MRRPSHTLSSIKLQGPEGQTWMSVRPSKGYPIDRAWHMMYAREAHTRLASDPGARPTPITVTLRYCVHHPPPLISRNRELVSRERWRDSDPSGVLVTVMLGTRKRQADVRSSMNLEGNAHWAPDRECEDGLLRGHSLADTHDWCWR